MIWHRTDPRGIGLWNPQKDKWGMVGPTRVILLDRWYMIWLILIRGAVVEGYVGVEDIRSGEIRGVSMACAISHVIDGIQIPG